MSWEKISNPKASTSKTVGGSFTNRIADYLNGVLLSSSFNPKIRTPTQYLTDALRIRDTTDSYNVTFTSRAFGGDVTLNLPNVTSGSHTLLTRASSDTITNKDIPVNSNTLKHSSTNAEGDILTFQTDRYNRLAMGADGTYLGVQGGVLGYYAVSGGGGGGGSGTITTASNSGTGGVGFFRDVSGSTIRLKNLNIASNKLTITDDTVNNEVKLQVNEANLSLGSMGGTLPVAKISPTGGTDGQVIKRISGSVQWANEGQGGSGTNKTPYSWMGGFTSNISTYDTRYFGVGIGYTNTSEHLRVMPMPFNFDVKRFSIRVTTNSMTGSTTVGFRAGGVTVNSVTVPASQVGLFEATNQSNTVTVDTTCCFFVNTSSSSAGEFFIPSYMISGLAYS